MARLRPVRPPARGCASAAVGMRGRCLRDLCCTWLLPRATAGGMRGRRLHGLYCTWLPPCVTDPASA
ncbi:hypothetical protein GW17_00058067 [Ensete ventricosum]|nr:hypothetical protein GW17_00058067 [Ensete ventricosum]